MRAKGIGCGHRDAGGLRAWRGVDQNLGAEMNLYDEKGKPCASLGVGKDESRLAWGDENGKVIQSAPWG